MDFEGVEYEEMLTMTIKMYENEQETRKIEFRQHTHPKKKKKNIKQKIIVHD